VARKCDHLLISGVSKVKETTFGSTGREKGRFLALKVWLIYNRDKARPNGSSSGQELTLKMNGGKSVQVASPESVQKIRGG